MCEYRMQDCDWRGVRGRGCSEIRVQEPRVKIPMHRMEASFAAIRVINKSKLGIAVVIFTAR